MSLAHSCLKGGKRGGGRQKERERESNLSVYSTVVRLIVVNKTRSLSFLSFVRSFARVKCYLFSWQTARQVGKEENFQNFPSILLRNTYVRRENVR